MQPKSNVFIIKELHFTYKRSRKKFTKANFFITNSLYRHSFLQTLHLRHPWYNLLFLYTFKAIIIIVSKSSNIFSRKFHFLFKNKNTGKRLFKWFIFPFIAILANYGLWKVKHKRILCFFPSSKRRLTRFRYVQMHVLK